MRFSLANRVPSRRLAVAFVSEERRFPISTSTAAAHRLAQVQASAQHRRNQAGIGSHEICMMGAACGASKVQGEDEAWCLELSASGE